METLKFDCAGEGPGSAVLTLNRPGALNALNTLMIKELLSFFREQAYNEGLRCLVITGAGERAFSTGGDLKERNGMSNDQWRHQHHLIEETFEALWNFPVPTIAAVEGFAYAGGCELALGTDFIIAAETAEFAIKEITRGILPGGGGIHRLARAIGVQRASEMIYTGRALKADQAYVTTDQFTKTDFSGWVNGAAGPQKIAAAWEDALPNLYIGGTGDSYHEPWQGDLAEMIVYARVLTDRERMQVEDYLAKKYGVQIARK